MVSEFVMLVPRTRIKNLYQRYQEGEWGFRGDLGHLYAALNTLTPSWCALVPHSLLTIVLIWLASCSLPSKEKGSHQGSQSDSCVPAGLGDSTWELVTDEVDRRMGFYLLVCLPALVLCSEHHFIVLCI